MALPESVLKQFNSELNPWEQLMIFLMKKRQQGINHWGELRRLAKEKFGSSDYWDKEFEFTLLLSCVYLSQPKRFDEFALELQIDELKQKGKSFKEIAKELKLPKRKVVRLSEKFDEAHKITLKQRAEFYGCSVSSIRRILKEKPKPATTRQVGYYIGDILYKMDDMRES